MNKVSFIKKLKTELRNSKVFAFVFALGVVLGFDFTKEIGE